MLFWSTSTPDSRSEFAEDAPTPEGRSPSPAIILLSPGVPYGDIGTNPLYALQTIVHLMGTDFTPVVALGSVSLIFLVIDRNDFSQVRIVRYAR
jgi:KUP system potassium uptake protein